MILKLLRPVFLCLGIVLPGTNPPVPEDIALRLGSCSERLEQIIEEQFGEGFLEDLANGEIEIVDD